MEAPDGFLGRILGPSRHTGCTLPPRTAIPGSLEPGVDREQIPALASFSPELRPRTPRAKRSLAMQTLHSSRDGLRHSYGFTLVELMVTVAVLAIIAAAAFAGFRQNEYRGQYKRFVDDCTGAIVTARNFAIDEQTIVQVLVQADRVDVRAFEDDTNTWNLIAGVVMDHADNTLVSGGNACIHGLVSGMQTPSQSIDVAVPTACSGALQTLQFEPDGTFTNPDDDVAFDNTGATLWIGNHQVSGEVGYSQVQIFPGGLIRTFVDTVVD
jgi:prepilin-type N-terminal cleavage/methylation domain-containing protein